MSCTIYVYRAREFRTRAERRSEIVNFESSISPRKIFLRNIREIERILACKKAGVKKEYNTKEILHF